MRVEEEGVDAALWDVQEERRKMSEVTRRLTADR
jgi:hypothetical protein